MTTKTPSSLSEALAIFQSKVKAADKNGKAKFPQPRTYSLLEDVIKALQPATELGLSHTQTFDYVPLEGGNVLTVLITTIYFKDQKLESKLPLKDMNGNNVYHDLGIAITYSRRYALAAAYGIGSEHDDDAVSLTQAPPAKKGVAKTPTKPNQKLEPVTVLDKLPDPITKEAKVLILEKLQTLHTLHPEKMKELVEAFRKQFGIKDLKITRHITTAIQGEYLALAISKIDESL